MAKLRAAKPEQNELDHREAVIIILGLLTLFLLVGLFTYVLDTTPMGFSYHLPNTPNLANISAPHVYLLRLIFSSKPRCPLTLDLLSSSLVPSTTSSK